MFNLNDMYRFTHNVLVTCRHKKSHVVLGVGTSLLLPTVSSLDSVEGSTLIIPCDIAMLYMVKASYLNKQ